MTATEQDRTSDTINDRGIILICVYVGRWVGRKNRIVPVEDSH